MDTRCCRCSAPASSLMAFDYGTRFVWLDDVPLEAGPAGYALCEVHAGRVTAPVAWTLQDRRLAMPPLPGLGP